MPWNDGLTQLQYELSDLYFREENIRVIAVQAGIPAAVLDIDGAALTAWYNVLREAANRQKVAAIVDIAKSDFPPRLAVLTRALAQHENGVGAGAAALAEFNRLLATYFKQIIAGIIVAVVTAWIMASVGKFFVRREFVILLLATIILLTPFLLRAGLIRLRITMQRLSLVLLSIFLMAGEAALFSEIVGGRTPTLVAGRTIDASAFLGHYLRGEQGCLMAAQTDLCYTQVKVKGQATDAQLRIQTSDWESPYLFLYLNVEWRVREEWPGLQRYFTGTMLFTSQYKCEADRPVLRELSLKAASFTPAQRLLSWLVGFIQIPYLRDADSTILNKVEDILVTQVNLCTQS